YTFPAADQGVHTFTATLKTAGWQALGVADTVYNGVSGTQYVEVTPAAMSQLSVAGFPSSVPMGTAGSLTVFATDAYGNGVSDYAGTVHFTSTDPAAILPADYTFTPADGGVKTFGATLRTAGTRALTVTDTAGITGTQGNIEVTAATTFLVYGFPSPVQGGTASSFTVVARDAYGRTVPGYTGAVHFTSTDLLATLPAHYTFTAADNGTHTFSATL